MGRISEFIRLHGSSLRTVDPFTLDDARDFHDVLAAAKKNGKWGFITARVSLSLLSLKH